MDVPFVLTVFQLYNKEENLGGFAVLLYSKLFA